MPEGIPVGMPAPPQLPSAQPQEPHVSQVSQALFLEKPWKRLKKLGLLHVSQVSHVSQPQAALAGLQLLQAGAGAQLAQGAGAQTGAGGRSAARAGLGRLAAGAGGRLAAAQGAGLQLSHESHESQLFLKLKLNMPRKRSQKLGLQQSVAQQSQPASAIGAATGAIAGGRPGAIAGGMAGAGIGGCPAVTAVVSSTKTKFTGVFLRRFGTMAAACLARSGPSHPGKQTSDAFPVTTGRVPSVRLRVPGYCREKSARQNPQLEEIPWKLKAAHAYEPCLGRCIRVLPGRLSILPRPLRSRA